jgi:hypothetical protein
MENLLANVMGDPQKMLGFYKAMESVNLIMEIMPKFEIKVLKLKDKEGNIKEYVAILFERPQKQEPPKKSDKTNVL